MDDSIVVWEINGNVLLLEELLQMLPVVHLLVKFKTVVELVHLYFIWEVPIIGKKTTVLP